MDIRTEPRGLTGFDSLAFARMKDGYSIAAVDYDMDGVRQMRRNLLGQPPRYAKTQASHLAFSFLRVRAARGRKSIDGRGPLAASAIFSLPSMQREPLANHRLLKLYSFKSASRGVNSGTALSSNGRILLSEVTE